MNKVFRIILIVLVFAAGVPIAAYFFYFAPVFPIFGKAAEITDIGTFFVLASLYMIFTTGLLFASIRQDPGLLAFRDGKAELLYRCYAYPLGIFTIIGFFMSFMMAAHQEARSYWSFVFILCACLGFFMLALSRGLHWPLIVACSLSAYFAVKCLFLIFLSGYSMPVLMNSVSFTQGDGDWMMLSWTIILLLCAVIFFSCWTTFLKNPIAGFIVFSCLQVFTGIGIETLTQVFMGVIPLFLAMAILFCFIFALMAITKMSHEISNGGPSSYSGGSSSPSSSSRRSTPAMGSGPAPFVPSAGPSSSSGRRSSASSGSGTSSSSSHRSGGSSSSGRSSRGSSSSSGRSAGGTSSPRASTPSRPGASYPAMSNFLNEKLPTFHGSHASYLKGKATVGPGTITFAHLKCYYTIGDDILTRYRGMYDEGSIEYVTALQSEMSTIQAGIAGEIASFLSTTIADAKAAHGGGESFSVSGDIPEFQPEDVY